MAHSGGTIGEDPRIGRVVADKYRIDAVVGTGATGVVYRAIHLRLDRPIALKVLDPKLLARPDAQARFRREARAASMLDHPNSVQVFDFGTEPDGLTYLAMELLDGRELYRVIYDDWPLSVARIVRIMTEVLSVLAAAHDAGIVHRDLKPENIMLVVRPGVDGPKSEVVKVTDFGIAKGIAGGTSEENMNLTRDGAVHGTPEYMSPEQARGEELDGRADLYACGVIMYEMLVGALPYVGDGAFEVILKQLSEPVPSLASKRAGVDLRLEPVVMRALAKRREDRFPDARAMYDALVRAAALPPRTAETTGPAPAAAVDAPAAAGPPALPPERQVRPTVGMAAPVSRRWWLLPALLLVSLAIALAYAGQRFLRSAGGPTPGLAPVNRPDASEPPDDDDVVRVVAAPDASTRARDAGARAVADAATRRAHAAARHGARRRR